MNIRKKVISDLTLCYCVAPLIYNGRNHFLVASEKEYACLLFDEKGNQVDKIWDGPGGTMSAVQIPGEDGAFLATHKFYSPNNSKEAKLVAVRHEDGQWKVKTVAELPYVHRFDILSRKGVNYLIACCLKSDYEYKDDWRFPGMTLACELPDDLFSDDAGNSLQLKPIKDGMLKNHGYCRSEDHGVMTAIVACDNGVFRFIPPEERGAEWTVETLLTEPSSDAIEVDLDGCGTPELLSMTPFHGDTLRVYKKLNGKYNQIWEYKEKLEFLHAICRGEVDGRPVVFVGNRKGARDLAFVSFDGSDYRYEVLDHDVGSANAMFTKVGGKSVLISANREINEVAYYTMDEA